MISSVFSKIIQCLKPREVWLMRAQLLKRECEGLLEIKKTTKFWLDYWLDNKPLIEVAVSNVPLNEQQKTVRNY